MREFFDFLVRHWDLTLAFVILVFLAIRLEVSTKIAGIELLSPQETTNLINHKHAAILDIRAPEAFAEGHIIGAINIPASDIDTKVKKLNKYRQKPIIVSCDSGNESPLVGAKLTKLEFPTVFALRGGIDAWKKADMPLEKAE